MKILGNEKERKNGNDGISKKTKKLKKNVGTKGKNRRMPNGLWGLKWENRKGKRREMRRELFHSKRKMKWNFKKRSFHGKNSGQSKPRPKGRK